MAVDHDCVVDYAAAVSAVAADSALRLSEAIRRLLVPIPALLLQSNPFHETTTLFSQTESTVKYRRRLSGLCLNFGVKRVKVAFGFATTFCVQLGNFWIYVCKVQNFANTFFTSLLIFLFKFSLDRSSTEPPDIALERNTRQNT